MTLQVHRAGVCNLNLVSRPAIFSARFPLGKRSNVFSSLSSKAQAESDKRESFLLYFGEKMANPAGIVEQPNYITTSQESLKGL